VDKIVGEGAARERCASCVCQDVLRSARPYYTHYHKTAKDVESEEFQDVMNIQFGTSATKRSRHVDETDLGRDHQDHPLVSLEPPKKTTICRRMLVRDGFT
jgi:hypothetical protein